MAVKRTLADVANELAALARSNDDSGPVKDRMKYWRQRCGEARGLVRDMDKQLVEAASALATASAKIKALQASIKAQTKTWIGPKVPPKEYQRPHRSNF